MPSPSHTAASLQALADAIGKDNPDDMETAWFEAWKNRDVRLLRDQHEHAVKAIVDFARMRARGDLTGGAAGYAEMVGKVIAKAVGRAT